MGFDARGDAGGDLVKFLVLLAGGFLGGFGDGVKGLDFGGDGGGEGLHFLGVDGGDLFVGEEHV